MTTELTTAEQILPHLQEWAKLREDLNTQLTAFEGLTNALPDCPLLAPVHAVWDAYSKLLSEKLGDELQWLGYYEYDCEMGKAPREVSMSYPAGQVVRIMLTDLEQLARMLSKERPPAP